MHVLLAGSGGGVPGVSEVVVFAGLLEWKVLGLVSVWTVVGRFDIASSLSNVAKLLLGSKIHLCLGWRHW